MVESRFSDLISPREPRLSSRSESNAELENHLSEIDGPHSSNHGYSMKGHIRDIEQAIVKSRRTTIIEAEKRQDLRRLPCREIPKYGDKKLTYVSNYLYAYSKIVSKRFPRIWYVETGAGPGVCKVRGSDRTTLGTPLLAMTNEPQFTDVRLIECKRKLAHALRERVRGYFPKVDADETVRTGDCNQLVSGILSGIPKYDPVLLFIDSEGLEVKWQSVIVPASQRGHIDMLINFPYDDAIHRNIAKIVPGSEFERKVKEFMPNSDWEKCIQEKYSDEHVCNDALREGFIEVYEAGLRELGMKYVLTSPPIRNKRNTAVYSFIFASKYEVAAKVMRDIFDKPDSAIQLTIEELPDH